MKNFGYPKINKYGAKKTIIDGITFASKTEAEYYALLKWEEKAGAIKILDLQPKVYLTRSRILYKPDFKIFDTNAREEIFIEIKGHETPVWRIKRKLWFNYGCGTLRIIKKIRGHFEMTEEITCN